MSILFGNGLKKWYVTNIKPWASLSPQKLTHTDLMFNSRSCLQQSRFTSYGELKFLVTCHFGTYHFRKSTPIPIEMTCELDPSVVSFLPGLALMKTHVWNQYAYFHISGWRPNYYFLIGISAIDLFFQARHMKHNCKQMAITPSSPSTITTYQEKT